MQDLSPKIEASSDLRRNIVRFAASGLWGEEQVKDGGARIGAAAAPFIKAREPWSILADYSDAIVQPRESAGSIRQAFEQAIKLGLQRIAVINSPMLVKMQYKRLADLLEIEFFETESDALKWLAGNAKAA